MISLKQHGNSAPGDRMVLHNVIISVKEIKETDSNFF